MHGFSSTLSFYRKEGQVPLPRAPSQLPASEVARLKKQG
ncbi:nickel uptake transporter family protein [Pseudomonas sp. GR 6-02]|nr:nickel uptake transporter family protein [Pseudomonas sp. GR 6-02]